MSVIQSATATSQGCIDFLSYAPGLDGWICGGWIELSWDDQDAIPHCILDFGEMQVAGEALTCIFPRADVRKIGMGLLLFVPGGTARGAEFQEAVLIRDGRRYRLTPSQPLDLLCESEANARSKGLVASAIRSNRRAELLRLFNRPSFCGQDTLDSLRPPVFLELDEACFCPPAGVLLRGWLIDPFGTIESLRVRCCNESRVLDLTRCIRLSRPDVQAGFAPRFGGLDAQCGFLGFVDAVCTAHDPLYIEVRSKTGEVAFKPIPALRSPGLDTIKDALSHLELRYGDLARGYDDVIGPAVTAMNGARLASEVAVREMSFGVAPLQPCCSIIVPLFGRIDFMELQLAFFSRTLGPRHEIIYVLDDPTLQRAAEALAVSCFARFGLSFRLLMLSANRGYAPANNIGLAQARGEYVCFLNSDVFPKTPDWLDCMVETAAMRRDVGVVGAMLLFEDETLQHEGCAFETLPEFGDWSFSLHPRKGRVPAEDESVRVAEAVTGACLLMQTALARDVGGFDEGYVIGDFEDVDLCRKAQAQGLSCVVDRRARLYHLERQSQGSQQVPWRLNLTLYNAWRFQNRWIRPFPDGRVA